MLNSLRLTLALVASTMLWGCGGSSSRGVVIEPPAGTPQVQFEVQVSNLTNAQPLSPVALIGHQSGYSVFSVGAAATTGLEQLAEGGDNAALLAEAEADSMAFAQQTGTAPIGPGGSETLVLTINQNTFADAYVSVASMLVNTNDGFTAVRSLRISDMQVGDSERLRAPVYDAGTEADSEGPGTIPGPAVAGEGFNAVRDDNADQVTMHVGVISANDGFADSVLSEQHRFDNPAALIVVTRTQ